MSLSSEYFRYWGKAQEGMPGEWHLLAYHMLDCAAVCQSLLDMDVLLLDRFEKTSSISAQELRAILPFVVACHDLGKFSRGFQSLRIDVARQLRPQFADTAYEVRHDTAGFLLWQHMFSEWNSRSPFLPVSVDGEPVLDRDDFRDALEPWFRATCGHHGQPPLPVAQSAPSLFNPEDMTAAEELVREFARLFRVGTVEIRAAGALEVILATSAWLVAGLVVLCDWVGSNTDYFPYHPEPADLGEYLSLAQERARRALIESGMTPGIVRGSLTLAQHFSSIYELTPTQRLAEACDLTGDGPHLLFIEDVTGSGKTEAALMLTYRLMAAGSADGLFFALPTMATSNQMYERIGTVYKRFFDEESTPSLTLTHSARKMYGSLRRDLTDTAYSAEVYCAAWLGNQSKKSLLASVAVGTIDQALLSVLPSRHNVLRLAGLHRKVLVVDEVHSYDPYMTTLLESLLEFHGRLGGSAILLSATLSHVDKQRLARAFARGCGQAASIKEPADKFPLVSHWSPNRECQVAAGAAPRSRRRIGIEWLHGEADAIALVIRSAAEGKAVCWVRNSVDDAIEAFDALRNAEPDLGERAQLFHARYILGDRLRIENDVLRRFGPRSDAEHRAGRVVIATQVVEQSLDLDFDVMVSDLAPIDLLIQRCGRLHRHPRCRAGSRVTGSDERGEPRLHVLAPEFDAAPPGNWLSSMFRRTSFVYPDHAGLWLTMKTLRERQAIVTPDDSRHLIESVYGAEARADLPESLISAAEKAEGRVYADRSLARVNALKPDQGYVSAGSSWLDDDAAITRLGEPTVRFRLAAISDNGSLQPLVSEEECRRISTRWEEADRWQLCDVTVRRAKLSGSAPGSISEAAIEAAKALMLDLGKWCELLPMRRTGERFVGDGWRLTRERSVTVTYGSDRGLVVTEDEDAVQPD